MSNNEMRNLSMGNILEGGLRSGASRNTDSVSQSGLLLPTQIDHTSSPANVSSMPEQDESAVFSQGFISTPIGAGGTVLNRPRSTQVASPHVYRHPRSVLSSDSSTEGEEFANLVQAIHGHVDFYVESFNTQSSWRQNILNRAQELECQVNDVIPKAKNLLRFDVVANMNALIVKLSHATAKWEELANEQAPAVSEQSAIPLASEQAASPAAPLASPSNEMVSASEVPVVQTQNTTEALVVVAQSDDPPAVNEGEVGANGSASELESEAETIFDGPLEHVQMMVTILGTEVPIPCLVFTIKSQNNEMLVRPGALTEYDRNMKTLVNSFAEKSDSVDERLVALSTRISEENDEIISRIDGVDEDIEKMVVDIRANESSYSQIQGVLARLEQNYGDLEPRIRALESTVESLQGSANTCAARQSAADTTIQGLHTDVAQASESVKVLAHCVEKINTESQALKENQELISEVVRKNRKRVSEHKQLLRDLFENKGPSALTVPTDTSVTATATVSQPPSGTAPVAPTGFPSPQGQPPRSPPPPGFPNPNYYDQSTLRDLLATTAPQQSAPVVVTRENRFALPPSLIQIQAAPAVTTDVTVSRSESPLLMNSGQPFGHSSANQQIVVSGPVPSSVPLPSSAAAPAQTNVVSSLRTTPHVHSNTFTASERRYTEHPTHELLNPPDPLATSTLSPDQTTQSHLPHDSTNIDSELVSEFQLEIDSLSASIKSIIDLPIPDDPYVLKHKVQTALPQLRNLTKSLAAELDRMKKECPREGINIRADARQLIRRTRSWETKLNDAYEDQDGYLVGTTKGSTEVKKLTKGGDQTVFEFFAEFEKAYRGNSAVDKAEILFKSFLDPHLKGEMEICRNNYAEMKRRLIAKLGVKDICIEAILRKIEGKFSPAKEKSSAKVAHFCLLSTVMRELVNLANKNDPAIDYDSYMTSYHQQGFINRLCGHMSCDEVNKFKGKLIKKGMNAEILSGKDVFKELQEFIADRYTYYMAVEHSLGSQVPVSGTQKQSAKVKAVQADESSAQVHNAKFGRMERDWYAKGLVRPCAVNGHNGQHEMGGCEEFISMDPKKRREDLKYKVCWTCLRPIDICRTGGHLRCSAESDMGSLICASCVKINRTHNRPFSPLNILMCGNSKHDKPNPGEIQNLLLKLFPGYTQKMQGGLVLYCSQVLNAAGVQTQKIISKTRAPVDEPEKYMNSCTGEVMELPDHVKIPESKEAAIYLIQTMKLAGVDATVFFDYGANINLIDGQFAEELSLAVVSQQPSSFKAANDVSVFTEYGSYKINIGPTPQGRYYEFIAHGVSPVTGHFPKFSLDAINAEVRGSGLISPDDILPEAAGGTGVHLLIGIKSASAHPRLVHELDSGLCIYESPFKDKYGSRYCYGGTHATLSNQVDRSSYASSYFLSRLNQISQQVSDTVEIIDSSRWFPSLEPGKTQLVQSDVDIEYPPGEVTVEGVHIVGENALDLISPLNINEQIHESPGLPESPGARVSCDSCSVCSACNPLSESSVHKSNMPIQRLRELADKDDDGDMVTFRCPTCSSCQRCKESKRVKARTRQEEVEQEIIEKSVHVDFNKQRVCVDLPFIKDPVENLTYRHGGPDNYRQALKVYKQQTNKAQDKKDRVRKAHSDLVEKGFMIKKVDLDSETQELIDNAPFKHYYPWRPVTKDDSISTPVRLVVDPTMTGLNLLLAKGECNIQSLQDILVRNRTRRFVWSSDISKMYNCLHLNRSSLPYSLFLFHESLDPNSTPDTYVMVVAWYGVTPTGGQASYAIEFVANHAGEDMDDAKEILLTERYVDDIWGGAQTVEARDSQTSKVVDLLARAGFKLKFIARSGEKPCDKASEDGETMRVLGYVWTPEQDFFAPGMGELNFNHKVRGSKKPNEKPIVTVEDAITLLESINLTRRICVSKVAEFFDPCGFWEPLKLELKLALADLTDYDWDQVLSDELQSFWKPRLASLSQLSDLKMNRSVVPNHPEVDITKARLITVVDAAEKAGGAAVYIGYEFTDGTYSCSLLTAKSRILKGTIPRNELSALLLGAELTFIVSKALGNIELEVVYATDSTIALSWVHNTEKRLKLYTYTRVTSIRRLVEWTIGPCDDLPIVHISSERNLADMLTKHHNTTIVDVNLQSHWQNGQDWMKLPTDQLPTTTYNDLRVDPSKTLEVLKETYNEPFNLSEPVASYIDEVVYDDPSVHFLDCVAKQVISQICESNDKCASVVSSWVPTQQEINAPGCNDRWVDYIEQLSALFSYTDEIREEVLANAAQGQGIVHESLSGVQSNVFNIDVSKVKRPKYNGIDVIREGWIKTMRTTRLCAKYACMWYAKTKERVQERDQHLTDQSMFTKDHTSQFHQDVAYLSNEEISDADSLKRLNHMGFMMLCRIESEAIIQASTPHQRRNYKEFNGVLYYSGRLNASSQFKTSDLDFTLIPDSLEFQGLTPVVLPKSPLLFSYVMYIHRVVRPHHGNETILHEVMKRFHILSHPRLIISSIRRDCIKCKRIAKQTVELEMAFIHPARLELAPVFYNTMLDIAYGPFRCQPFRKSRSTIVVYALVLVCLLTSATNILVLESLETQEVISCIERHGCRFGMPSQIFVDSGSQLCALQSTKFSLRDANTFLYDSRGLVVTVGTPKHHANQGRVERRIKAIRDTLEKVGVNVHSPLSVLQWETVFAKVANALDDLPIATGNASNVSDIGREIITPNRLKLGRNNHRSLEGSVELTNRALPCDILDRNRRITCMFMKIIMERIHLLITSWNGKWKSSGKQPQEGDIVLFRFSDNTALPDNDQWKLGKVITAAPTKCKIMYPGKVDRSQVPTRKFLERSHRDVVILFSENDPAVNSNDYFEEKVVFNKKDHE